MREVARYALATDAAPVPDQARQLAARVEQAVLSWLDGKGTREPTESGATLRYPDGRVASLVSGSVQSKPGSLDQYELDEPTAGGLFRTRLAIARSPSRVVVYASLYAGSPSSVMAPVAFEAHCPLVIRNIAALDAGWRTLDTPTPFGHRMLTGEAGGAELAQLITSDSRSLPLVVVSDYEGLPFHPRLAENIGVDLTALAIVVHATERAAWYVTASLGTEWSCYNGAVRLYWPKRVFPEFHRHPLWTPHRLLEGAFSTDQASKNLRTLLRRRILGLSTLTLRPDPLLDEIEAAHRTDLARARRAASSDQEWITELERENALQSAELRALKEKLAGLTVDLANERALKEWTQQVNQTAAEGDAPLRTVADAVTRSRREHKHLVFGKQVDDGVGGLVSDAGPPARIYQFLGGLNDLAQALAKGSLGAQVVDWLTARGFKTTGESETTVNSKTEMKNRTWHDGEKSYRFELHMKPTDGTSPDRCVRIYFYWDSDARVVRVGWVGRHPGT